MALSGLRENVILTIIILITDGSNGCLMGDTFSQLPLLVGPPSTTQGTGVTQLALHKHIW